MCHSKCNRFYLFGRKNETSLFVFIHTCTCSAKRQNENIFNVTDIRTVWEFYMNVQIKYQKSMIYTVGKKLSIFLTKYSHISFDNSILIREDPTKSDNGTF